jgi:pyrroline-5-carboxylate reductase
MSLQSDSGEEYQLGFIGGGKLAGSVVRGLVRAGYCEVRRILVSEPADAVREKLAGDTGVHTTSDNAELARRSEVILAGVKPQVVLKIVEEIASVTEGKIVISLAAGIRIANMEAKSPARFLRAMTNTPAAVCQAATAIARGTRTTAADMSKAREIFSSIGFVAEVEEMHIDAVTALAGSGPAFVYSVIEALAKGGSNCGLPAGVSLGLAIQTVRGAAQLALESGLSPEELRQMVITPGGTTAAGLSAMDKLGTSAGLIAAVEAASARGREMGLS